MTPRFVVVPAAYVFLLRTGPTGDEVLLQLRQNTGYMDAHWAAATAGHIERGETAYDAAQRESAEELGLDGVDLSFGTQCSARAGRTQSMSASTSSSPLARGLENQRSWSRRSAPRFAGARSRPCPDPVVPHERAVLDGLRLGGLPAYTLLRLLIRDNLGPNGSLRGAVSARECPSADFGPSLSERGDGLAHVVGVMHQVSQENRKTEPSVSDKGVVPTRVGTSAARSPCHSKESASRMIRRSTSTRSGRPRKFAP